MPITRADLLKKLMPGITALFGIEYTKYSHELYDMKLDMDKHTVEVEFDENANVRTNDSNE